MIKVRDHRTSRSSAFGKSWLLGVLLLALVILAYLPATRCAFIWDDDTHLTANPCIVGPLGLKEIWTTSHARICPLVQTTFWLEYKIWDLNPMPYHLVNILFHAAACLVLWRVLLRLQVTGAWLGAALWALHPVQVTSVAWITELKNTQSGLFFLLCILFFCKSKQVGADSRQHLEDSSQCPPSSLASFHYSLSILFGALAMTSKSSTVVLPLVLGLCVWWMDGRWRWRPNLMQLTPLFLMSGLTGLVTMWTQKFEGANWEVVIPMNALERVTLAGRVLCFYLGKLLWPSHLMMVYPRWDISAAGLSDFLPLITVMIVSVVLWLNRNRWNGRGRALWFSWTCYVIALLPVMGVLHQNFHRYSFVADHFQYLASMSILALAGAGITTGLGNMMQSRRAVAVLCSLPLLALGTLTWRQSSIYQNEETLWRATLTENPTCLVAHNNLGRALLESGRLDESKMHLEKALELKPGYAEAHYNLGGLFDQAGQQDESLAHLDLAIKSNPGYAEAHNNLGVLLQRKGRLDEALPHFQESLKINPGYAAAHLGLGNALLQKGQANEALEHFKQAIEIKPRFAEAHFALAGLLMQKGLPEDAMTHFELAVECNPRYAEAHNNLGILLAQRGRLDEAEAHYQKAVEVLPRYALGHRNLGSLLIQKGRFEEALKQLKMAVELKPDDVQSLNNLAYLLATSERQELRDGTKAVEFAQRASQVSGGNNPGVLSTLAAAQAEMKNFPAAVETIQRAIGLAQTQNLTNLLPTLQDQLKLYQDNKPLRIGNH